MGWAETPNAVIIASDEWDGVRLLRERAQVRLQFLQGELGVDGDGVADDLKVTVDIVDHNLAVRPDELRPRDIPLVRNHPLEDLGAGRDLMERQARQAFLEDAQGLACALPVMLR